MIRDWLCRHGIHNWTPNNMGGTKRWCNRGAHWEGGTGQAWLFSRPQRASQDAWDLWAAQQPWLRSDEPTNTKIAFQAGFHMGVGQARRSIQ